MQRENIYSTGVTHDDRLMTIKIILKSGHWDSISNALFSSQVTNGPDNLECLSPGCFSG
jgi:hypothetical protein